VVEKPSALKPQMVETVLRPTNYLYDGVDIGANVIQELDNSWNLLARYAPGLGMDQQLAELRSGVTSYYQQDGLGSVSSLSNSAATLANTYIYDSFGNLAASTGTLINPFQYAGRDFDSEDGLHYNRHRFYDSNVGRFISGDPTGFSGGINFYHYVGNSPVGNVDPLGLARCTFIVSQGTLWCWPQQPGHNGVFINVASGNNGHGMHCKNNPDCDLLRDRGPLPRGWWRWTNGPTGKLNGRVLVPMPGTYNGRSLIRSHSCKNPFGPSVDSPFCSEGCMTGTPGDIQQLNKLIDSEPDSTLYVTD